MSNGLAIAAATATLRSLLIRGTGVANVTVRPLDSARKGLTTDQLNLFLYQASTDGAWRNMDMPRQVRPGEAGQPPLPLVLDYLLTAFSDDEDDTPGHSLLGRAMSIFHDHPVLDAQEIRDATETALRGSDLHQQLERVRITLQPMSLEEISKLWTAFQTQYRTSAAYRVSVVLIESTRPVVSPLPVLARGEADRGVQSVAGSLPKLDEVQLPLGLPAAELGERITLTGQSFSGDSVVVKIMPPGSQIQLPGVKVIFAAESSIVVELPTPGNPADPNAPVNRWPAGPLTVAVTTKHKDSPDRTSEERPVFPLAPKIAVSPLTAAHGDFTVHIDVTPSLQKNQKAILLFGDQSIAVPERTAAVTALDFDLKAVQAGEYVVRLRVEGVDSIPVDRASATPKFDDAQKVKVT